jgi:hypothetical protein
VFGVACVEKRLLLIDGERRRRKKFELRICVLFVFDGGRLKSLLKGLD